jgi:hypothetical protein
MSEAFRGSVRATMVWAARSRSIDTQGDEETICRILRSVGEFTAYGVDQGSKAVIARSPAGRTLMEVQTVKGCKIVVFTHHERGADRTVHFWMNASSVADIAEAMRVNQDKRVAFEDIYFNF